MTKVKRVIRCPKCKKYLVTTSTNRINCKYCNKSSVFKKKNELGFNVKVVFSTYDGSEAAEVCRKYNNLIKNR